MCLSLRRAMLQGKVLIRVIGKNNAQITALFVKRQASALMQIIAKLPFPLWTLVVDAFLQPGLSPCASQLEQEDFDG